MTRSMQFARFGARALLGGLIVVLLGALSVGCSNGGDESGTDAVSTVNTQEVEGQATTEVEQTPAEQTVAEVAGVEWSGFCSSEQRLFEDNSDDFRALEHSQLDYAELEVALAPGGVPTSDEAADMLALLRAMAESWDDLGAAIEGAIVDVDTDVDLSGYTLLVLDEGVMLVSFRYADDPSFGFAEQEAITFQEASRALADKAQLLGLGECSLLADETEETEPATSE